MKSEVIQKLQSQFDTLAQTIPGESIEFWFARDLQVPLGYHRWENFIATIKKAIDPAKQPVTIQMIIFVASRK